MKIIQVKEAFAGKPRLRDKSFLANNKCKIIICDEDQKYIDVGELNRAHKDRKYRGSKITEKQIEECYPTGISGIFYHYVIKGEGEKPGQAIYDGDILECRPLFQQNELPYLIGDEKRNSIAICMGGVTSEKLSDKQKDSLVDLCVFLIQTEELKSEAAVLALSDEVGNFPELSDIIGRVGEKLALIALYKNIQYTGPTNIEGVSGYYKFVVSSGLISEVKRKREEGYGATNEEWNVLKEVAEIIGGSDFDKMYQTLLLMNPHLKDLNLIPPNSVIFTPESPTILDSIANSQSDFVKSTILAVESKIEYELIEKGEYLQLKNVRTDYDDINVYFTTYGGKAAPTWKNEKWEMPGYHNCILRFTDLRGGQTIIPFLVSPSSFQESRSNTQQMNKTNAGWFLMRTGKNPISISFTGFMLDMKHELERHKFLENYKTYCEDVKNNKFEYVSQYKTDLVIEGRTYYGSVQNISFNKAAVQTFLYQYSVTFIALDERQTYNPAYAASSGEEDRNLYSKYAGNRYDSGARIEMPVLKNMPERIYGTLSK